MVLSVVVHNKKFIHAQNHLNEQVDIELVFYNFFHMNKAGVIELVFFYALFIHMKKAFHQHKAGGY